MQRIQCLSLALIGFVSLAQAQRPAAFQVTGQVADNTTSELMPGVTVLLWNTPDSSYSNATASNLGGRFALQVPTTGQYRLRLSFVGYETLHRDIQVATPIADAGRILLQEDVIAMEEILVEDVQERIRVSGDTTIFNADAFTMGTDASAQDLVEKMPGMVVQDGQVEAQGEQVQRVMVDGREFFGNDPTTALQNLPAEVVQSVEIFDRQSDQAQFTGFNDGNAERTINIVTRADMRNGQFGKVYGGYGDESRYASGGNANIFNNDRRISLIGLANNVNIQNFAFEDLLGITGRASSGRGMRMRGGGGARRGGGRRGGSSGFNPRDFLVSNQSGLNTTTSTGVNYSDEIGSRLKVNGSYFFNRMANSNDTFLDRELFLASEQSQFYNETAQSSSTNINHRMNGRISYEINENNSLLIRPSLSFQNNASTSLLRGINTRSTGALLNNAINDYSTDDRGLTSSTDILYRHRFAKPGRTISANLEIGFNDQWGNTDQVSVTEFYIQRSASDDSTYDQVLDNQSAGRSLGFDIDFTERLGETTMLRLSYEPSVGRNVSDRYAFVRDLRTGLYTVVDPSFSSLFDNNVVRQRGGISLQKNVGERIEIQLGLEAQNEQLLGDQTYPLPYVLDRSFFSILPEVEVEIELVDGFDLDIDYRTGTRTPSVSQLQDVVDNTNPLFLSTGNPNLKPSFTHNIRLRGRRGNWREGRMIYAFMDFTYEKDPIGTASLLASNEMVLDRGIVLSQGAQFSQPINLTDPNISARSFFGFGAPVEFLKSNVNFRGGVRYSRTPGLINGQVNTGTQVTGTSGLTIGSNISPNLDFTVTYSADYTIASNSFYQELDENYYRHDTGLRFSWLPAGGLVLETGGRYNDYLGLDEELYPTTFIMSAGVGYKFMQQDAVEVKMVVGDIFNQENGINRSITELYVEDSRTQVLGRYVLLNLSYRFRNFGF